MNAETPNEQPAGGSPEPRKGVARAAAFPPLRMTMAQPAARGGASAIAQLGVLTLTPEQWAEYRRSQ
jgi:hypothetical protein